MGLGDRQLATTQHPSGDEESEEAAASSTQRTLAAAGGGRVKRERLEAELASLQITNQVRNRALKVYT